MTNILEHAGVGQNINTSSYVYYTLVRLFEYLSFEANSLH